MKERTIRVTGTGRVSIKPDIAIINLHFDNILPTYELALKSSADDIAVVKNAIEKAGIERESLKTTSFDIDTHYHSVKDERGNYKSVFDGYKYSQSLRFQFDVDNKLLGSILFQLSKLNINVEFNLRYGVKDNEAAKNMLLSNAIQDAMKKASIIAKAANVELNEIIDINYSWVDFEFHTRPYDIEDGEVCKCCAAPETGSRYDIDIEPEDIDRSDNVTIVYSLK